MCASPPSARALTASLRETVDRLYRERRRGADARPAWQRRRPAQRGGALVERLRRGRRGGLDRSRTQGERTYEAVGDAIDPRPTVVLVDRDTASAVGDPHRRARVYDLAEVVGTRTFGKGTFQEVIAAGSRRRARPDDRPVPDRRRDIARRRGDQARRPCRGRPADRRAPTRRSTARSQVLALELSVGRAVTASSAVRRRARGRFLVAEPLFERGPQLALARGRSGCAGARWCWPSRAAAAPGCSRCSARRSDARDVVARCSASAASSAASRERSRKSREAARAAREADATARAPRPHRARRPSPSIPRPPATSTTRSLPRREGDGVRLWIHIADVAAHVRPGSALDREALPAREQHLRPGCGRADAARGALSADACSLAPGVERLAVTPRSARRRRARRARRASIAAGSAPTRASTTTSSTRSSPGAQQPPPRGRRAARARAPRGGGAAPTRRAGGALEVRQPSPSSSSTPTATSSARACGRADRGPPTDRAADDPHQRAGRRAAASARGVPTLYRVHEQPDPQRIAVLSSSSPRSTCRRRRCPTEISPTRGAASSPREASRLVAAEAERRGHGRAAYTSLVLRSLKQAHYSAPQPRPRRARQPRLLPLHLADPPLPGPDRPPRAARRCRRGGGRARARARSARPAPGARSASARRGGSSATPTTSAPRSCSSASCSRRAGRASSRARSRA